MEFSTLQIDSSLQKGLSELGFSRATPIQEQAIPAGLEGRDILAAAMTGSGKTAAFLLPILNRLLAKPRGTTRCLVLTPTRELAAQILDHMGEIARFTKLTGASVFGGVAMGPQERAFKSGVDVLIATPGRLLDHMRSPYARLPGLEFLVLDEADRMLDMGFLPDVRRILAHIPRERQTLFFSATLPQEVLRLSKEMLRNPVSFNVERKAAPATGVTQSLYPVPQELKSHLLLELLQQGKVGSTIVFTRTKHRANRLSAFLEKKGVPNACIHGNRSQSQRTAALAGFKDHRIRVLVATDIVARGIDVEQLQHVVNFDVPNVPDDYIHRVGRTARADAVGEAYTFVASDEEGDVSAIEKAIGKKLVRVKLPEFDYTARPREALEVPLSVRIAEIRAKKADDRVRAAAKQARRTGGGEPPKRSPASPPPGRGGGGGRGPGPGSDFRSRDSGGYRDNTPRNTGGFRDNNRDGGNDRNSDRGTQRTETQDSPAGVWRSRDW